MLREQDKHFLWSLLVAVGIIFVWKGLWEGLYEIPYLGDSYVALFIGFAMLTFSGLIFREFDPLGSLEKSVNKIIKEIKVKPHKHEYVIKYFDAVKKEHLKINGNQIRGIEKGSLIIKHNKENKEFFIPAHRITEVLHKGKTYWKS